MRVRRPHSYPAAAARESPVHRVRLPRYLLARYPVTVGQWSLYYDAVSEESWQPTRPDGKRFELLDERSLQGVATQPAVCVSWYDAMDYARWLTARVRAVGSGGSRTPMSGVPATIVRLLQDGHVESGGRPWVMTLPSEAEWERAARGPKTTARYPWGDTWDENRAKVWKAAFQAASAVGAFPGGTRSANELPKRFPDPAQNPRLEEMSGNVWEWTRTVWGRDWRVSDFPYPYMPDYQGIEREQVHAAAGLRRIVRGGSFNFGAGNLRCSTRNNFRPSFRHRDVGFRLAVAPFVLSADA